MEKDKQQCLPIDAQALQNYLVNLFPESTLPPLTHFLKIKHHSHDRLLAPALTLLPNTALPPEVQSTLELEALIYLHTGIVELHKRSGRSWQRQIEHKQNSFFSLINFKNMTSTEPEWTKLMVKTKCVISVIPIQPNYGYHWIRQNWHKNQLLAKVFYYNDSGIDTDRKKHRFKEFTNHFAHESFRRDTRFVLQGHKNEKLYIISRGQAKIYKQLQLKKNKDSHVNKNVEILFLNEGSIIGSEIFLINSHPIHTIISNHSATTQTPTLKETLKEEQEEENEQTKKNKRRVRSRLGKVSVDSGGYELYSPHQNVSNYTVVAESANLQVFSLSIDTLVSIISQRNKINFLKFIEQTYVTILRRTYQKMTLQLQKEQEKAAKSHQNISIMTAKAFSSNKQPQTNSKHSQRIEIKSSQVGVATEEINQLRRKELQRSQKQSIQKRVSLMMRQAKPTNDFAHKIGLILESKLGREVRTEEAQAQVAQELAEIFMKENEGRTEEIEKQSQLLQRKSVLLSKLGGWQPGWDKLKKDSLVATKPLEHTPNYLGGVDMEDYTYRLKVDCATKIHQANKIKEQFIKIRSECPTCCCYDNFEHFSHRRTQSLARTAYRTADGWGRASCRTPQSEPQPLETVYNSMKFLSEKTKEKYNHNVHLLKKRRNRDRLDRRSSAPTL